MELFLVWDSESEVTKDGTILESSMTAEDADSDSDSSARKPKKKKAKKKAKKRKSTSSSASEANCLIPDDCFFLNHCHVYHFEI